MSLYLAPGMRHPIFVGSGGVDFTKATIQNSTDFRVILEASAVVTPTVDIMAEKQPWKSHVQSTDKKDRGATYYYPTPIPEETIQNIVAKIRRIKALPKPEAMVRDKPREFILNVPYDIPEDSLDFLIDEPNLFFGVELNINNVPSLIQTFDTTYNLDKKLERLRNKLNIRHFWLKIPSEGVLYKQEFLAMRNPTALVVAHGLLSYHDTFNDIIDLDNYPILQSGTPILGHTVAVWKHIKDKTQLPIILGGGFRNAKEILPLLKDGVSGIQITSSVKNRWLNIIPIYRQLKNKY